MSLPNDSCIDELLLGDDTKLKGKGLLPDITDVEIDELYKDMIKDDPDHSKFKGSKREYVQEVYVRIKTFLLLQEVFSMKRPI